MVQRLAHSRQSPVASSLPPCTNVEAQPPLPPLPSPRVTAGHPFVYWPLILPWGIPGPSHLLSAMGLLAGPSGRSVSQPCCSVAVGEANSLPPLLEGTDKRRTALRAPGRTNRGMASLHQPPIGGDLPCPTWAPGHSGFSEPVCPPLPPPEQLPLRPVSWIGGVGWGSGGLRSGPQRSKQGPVGGGQCLLSPLLPTPVSSPVPCVQ